MEQRKLGSCGLQVSAIGFGCMGLTGAYGPLAQDIDPVGLVHRALELGYTLFDTAPIYGGGSNEALLGRALQGRRDQVVLSTKFGFVLKDARIERVDGRAGHIRESVEASLRHLQTDHIDILFQHRVDPDTPIEETVDAMAALVREGKVRYLGLSEASASTIRRAHAVHPISAVQSEYSLLERGLEDKVLPACRELGIGIMPFSPLGRGLVSGLARAAADLPKSDYRRIDPRYQGENYERNMALVRQLADLAADLQITPSQLALAWLLSREDNLVPLVGTTKPATLAENAAAAQVKLDAAIVERLNTLFAPRVAAGERYPQSMMRFVDQSDAQS